MKKTTSVLLLLVILLLPVLSFATDYSDVPDENLLSELNQIRTEILRRELNPENIILDSDGIVIYLAGELQEKKRYDDTISLIIPVIAINNGDAKMSGAIGEICINGWEIEDYNSVELDPGKKTKGEFEIRDVYGQSDITSISDIQEIEFYGSTTNPDTYRFVTQNLRKTIVFK